MNYTKEIPFVLTTKEVDKVFIINHRIGYNTKSFDGIICLDGDIPSTDFFKEFKNIPVLAADGSAIKLIEIGIIPDFVVGDLDSFSSSSYFREFDKNKVFNFPDQESNDFEKVIKFAIAKGINSILIVGFNGGELEHTLNNWSVYKRFSRVVDLCLYSENRYGITVNKSIELETEINEMISIIPQPEARLTIKNFKWELNNEELKLGSREGARNIALADKVYIFIHYGEILVFFNSRIPFAPQKF